MSWWMSMMNPFMDDAFVKMMTQDYPSNIFLGVTIGEKLTPIASIEAGMRAELGTSLQRPLGSPRVLSPWEKMFFSPKQLFEMPSKNLKDISSKTIIGPNAATPLILEIPIMIAGMSYGGSLSMQLKKALAKGASIAGTCTNTGESSLTDEERNNARLLIGQYNRGGWLNDDKQLKKLDAIEVQLGQGAYGGAVETTIKAKTIGEHLRKTWKAEEGQDAVIYSRLPNVNTSQDVINLMNTLKSRYPVPVGIKIAGSDYIEQELEVISQTQADFIVIDGSEGGTAAAPPTLEDDIGLPTLHSLNRASLWLEENNVRERFSLIAAGGLKTPGEFLKAMALGADAVYIGSIAIVAALHTQMKIALPKEPPAQIALYTGKLKNKLNVDEAANHLANFLKSCIEEMKMVVQAVGKTSFDQLNREDLVSLDKDLAEFAKIHYAGDRYRVHNQYQTTDNPEELLPV